MQETNQQLFSRVLYSVLFINTLKYNFFYNMFFYDVNKKAARPDGRTGNFHPCTNIDHTQ